MSVPFINTPQAGPTNRRLGAAWHNANASNYVWTQVVPTLTAPGQKALHNGAGSFQIENLGNVIYSSAEAEDYTIGDSPPDGKARGRSTITYQMRGKHGAPDVWPLAETAGGGEHAGAYWDSYKMCDAQMRSRAYQRREAALVAHLTTDSIYGDGAGSQLSFTGTQDLDARDTSGDQQPFRDMTTQKIALMKYWRPGLRFVGIGDPIFFAALSNHIEFHGALAGSGAAAHVSEEEAIEIVRRKLGFQAVYNVTCPVNTAGIGATESIGYTTTTGFFWMGLVDERTSFAFNTDLSITPDGAFACAQAGMPWTKIWKEEGKESVLYADRDEFDFFAIRGASFGRCFTGQIT